LKTTSQATGTKENRYAEETITLDAQGQPHSIFQKRILGAK